MNLERTLAEKRRIIVPLVVGLIANVVLFVAVLFPLGRQVASAEEAQHAAHDQLNKARDDDRLAKATVSGKQQADGALVKFYKDVLPTDSSVALRLTFTRLAQLAEQANVKLEHGNNAVEKVKGSSLSKVTTSYTLTGDYRAVRQFIYSLETAPEFIVLENVTLSSANENQQQNRTLGMNLEIATYYRSGDAAN
jgi:Tfp pilus assembly protein PilO